MKNHYQPNAFNAPSPERVPVMLRPYVDRLNGARDKWREATDRAAAAQQRAASEPAEAMAAAVAAAADGRPVPAATNTADLERDAEIATAALDACAHRVREAWHAMALFAIDNRAQLLPLADGEPLAASADVVVAEHSLANAKHRYADSLGIRSWLSEMCRPRGAGAILSGTNGPRPRPGMTLREIHEAEAEHAPQVTDDDTTATPETEPVLVLASEVNATDAEGAPDVLDTEAGESESDAVIDGDSEGDDTDVPSDAEAEPDALAPEAPETPTGEGNDAEVIDTEGDTPVLDGDVSTDDGEPIAEDN